MKTKKKEEIKKNTKHEDKIAALLERMQARKDRKKASLLVRKERSSDEMKRVKLKEKISRVKPNLDKKKTLKKVKESPIERSISIIGKQKEAVSYVSIDTSRSKREKVPTSKIIDFKNSLLVKSEKIPNSKKNENKEEVPVEQTNKRIKIPTTKILSFKESFKGKKKEDLKKGTCLIKEENGKKRTFSGEKDTDEKTIKRFKTSTSKILAFRETLKGKKKGDVEKDTCLINEENSKDKQQTHKKVSKVQDIVGKEEELSKRSSRGKNSTAKFLSYKGSLNKSKKEQDARKNHHKEDKKELKIPKNDAAKVKTICKITSSSSSSLSEEGKPTRVRVLTSKFLSFRESLKDDDQSTSQNSKSEIALEIRKGRPKNQDSKVSPVMGKEHKEDQNISQKPAAAAPEEPKKRQEKSHESKKGIHANIREKEKGTDRPSRERVQTSKFIAFKESLNNESLESKEDFNVKQSTDKSSKEKIILASKKVEECIAPLEKLKNRETTPLTTQNKSRKEFMEALLNAHYSGKDEVQVQETPINNKSDNLALHDVSVEEPKKMLPIQETLDDSDDDEFYYIEIDDDISFKSPSKTNTDQDNQKSREGKKEKSSNFTKEMNKFRKIAPKSRIYSRKNSKDNQAFFIPSYLCDTVSISVSGFYANLAKRHNIKNVEFEFFKFPSFQGFNCSLQGSKYNSVNYYVTEVVQPKKNDHFQMPENLSVTCLFFVPHIILSQFEHLKRYNNILIPYQSHSKGFAAFFPNSSKPLQVNWATNIGSAEHCVLSKSMFILTKSRFKLIQSVRGGGGGKDNRAFCKMLDDSQIQLENFVRLQTETMLQTYNSTAQEVTPQVTLDRFPCPIQGCDFVSERKYSGIRNHLLKHFKTRIENEAKPRAFLAERDKSNCMSTTGCSVSILVSRGELVHHYGIFHCLVDDLFQEYAMKWLKCKFSEHFERNQCPYEDYHYTDEADLLNHLTSAHFFNGILAEVEDMVKFSLSFFEEYKCMANMYKCPFCKKKFKNLATGSNVRDVKEMVIHCGVEHGFALYYLMTDPKVEEMRAILKELQVKQEPLEEEEDGPNMMDPEDIKTEPLDEETDINNYLHLEIDDN